MSSEKKYSAELRQEASALPIDQQQLVTIQSSSSSHTTETHYHPSYVDSSELMAALIGPQVTPSSQAMSSPSSQQPSPCHQQPPLLLTLGTPQRLQNLNSQPQQHSTAQQSQSHSVNVSQNGFNSTGPFLRIIEQPTNRIRYRYKSEKGSHGGLTGESSTQTKKTYPMVRLENYRSSRQLLVKASLYTNEENPKPHIHKLMGKYCNEEGVCIVPLGENNTAIFQNLGILFVGKKEVPEILYRQKLDEQRLLRVFNDESNLSEEEKQRLKEEAEREAKRINLNSVKICFQAFDCNNDVHYPICDPVFSRPVANQKSPDSGELKIVRMDKYSGVCTGDEEVFLLCEKVNKKEIKVRFFEADNEGSVLWEAYGNFTEADVHHQVAIVFRTPPYRDQNIENAVQVYLQLYRPKDGEYSEPRPFTYKPKEYDKDCVDIKRKKVSHYNPGFSGGSFGHFSGNGRYIASGDGDSSSGPTSNSEGSGMNYYGNHCSLFDQINYSNVSLFTQIVVQTLRRFAISGDLKAMLTSFRELIPIPDEEGDTILHLSVMHQTHKTFEFVKLFIQLSALLPDNVINAKNNLHQTPLHLAVILQQAEIVAEIIKNGGNTNIADLNGNTALHLACKIGDLSVIKMLLNRRIYSRKHFLPNAGQLNYDGVSPLHIAVKNRFHKIVDALIEFGADINAREGKSGQSCLHIAVANDDLSLVKLLLSKKSVDVNQQDYAGNAALHLACAHRLNHIIEALIDANADLFIENYDYDSGDEEGCRKQVDYEDDYMKTGKTPSDYYPELCDIAKERRSKSKQCEEAEKQCDDDGYSKVDSKIFDSGYGRKINIVDEETLERMCTLLDPPSTEWEKLAMFLGIDEDLNLKTEDSPTRYIMERFEVTI
ncbi:nuclear factor NF-kappa-B p105 subunit-like protein [Dinothrombium tinctorium]|uniref:Nuclear factor NF-kappa-B p105 subunit-like protein n=1 Tax=Dinothrombium tinctorium TaxID=1965070 RepID=A0A443RC07_9ACAR|nr:nuclear factor NF-kappa-B p105 subunit-like protein [Dinothrombium tinctorium]